MKKVLSVILCLSPLAMLLAACRTDYQHETMPQSQEHNQQVTQTQPAESRPSASAPIVGTSLTETLTVTGDFSRSHKTSTGRVWEVKNGFYYLSSQRILHYADKTDLSNRVPVCSKPDCEHNPNQPSSGCEAMMDQVMVINERIYGSAPGADNIFTLCSTALNGTDLREEFTFTEAEELMAMGAGSGVMVMPPEYLVCYVSAMNQQGTYDFRVYTADKDGVALQVQEERGGMSVLMNRFDSGDGLWFNGPAIIDDFSRTVVYRLSDGALISAELTGLWVAGAYFDGQSIQGFRPGEGYFRTVLATGEETRLAEPMGSGTAADIALPNCILESTLFTSGETRTAEKQEMWLFDGQQWLEVALPEELQSPAPTQYIRQNVTVASDRILLELVTEEQSAVSVCQILLGTDELVMEYLDTIG